MPEHQLGAIEYWNQLHHKDANTDWIAQPTLFAHWAISYFPKKGRLLDLGAGQGQDSRFFAQRGYEVTMTDISDVALQYAKQKLAHNVQLRVEIVKHDLATPLPFPDNAFDIVYSHLALHYFDAKITQQIYQEIYRVLKPRGILAVLVNSAKDPDFGLGQLLEPDVFLQNGMVKHYFTPQSLLAFTGKFATVICDDEGAMTKDITKRAGGTDHLVRFIGKK